MKPTEQSDKQPRVAFDAMSRPKTAITRGSRVRLKSNGSLNKGCMATVLNYLPESRSWDVSLDSPCTGAQRGTVKAAYLELVPPPKEPAINLQHLLRQLDSREHGYNHELGQVPLARAQDCASALLPCGDAAARTQDCASAL